MIRAVSLGLLLATTTVTAEDQPCLLECMEIALDMSKFDDCMRCLGQLNLGSVDAKYATDMLSLRFAGGYTRGWCRHRDSTGEGVDLETHPSGWMPSDDGKGFTGCEKTTDFPGYNTVSHQSHAFVKKEMKKLPGMTNDGSVWRGNELGFIICNSMWWPNVSPRSILLGSSPKQHKVIRPILDKVFTCGEECEKHLMESAHTFMQRPEIRVQTDVKIWAQNEIFKMIFPGETPLEPERFVEVQGSFTTLQPFVQIAPAGLRWLIARDTMNDVQEFFKEYQVLTEKHYGDVLKGEDCAPTDSCVDQLASAFLDLMLTAGGLSVPGALSTGLWVMYGNTQEHEDTFPEYFRLDNHDPLSFYYESMRFFAPVVGLPWWTVPPARATDDEADQMEGGKRTVLNLALAQKDPNAWGPDAHKFRVRDISEYKKNFVGFADFAKDSSVAGGAMDRVCPAKNLALVMGKAFFKNFEQDSWHTTDSSSYMEVTPFVDEFTLTRARNVGFWTGLWVELTSLFDRIPDAGRFDLYSRSIDMVNNAQFSSWSYPQAADVSPPQLHEPVEKVPCGLIYEVMVPKDDEDWQETEDLGAFVSSELGRNLAFPETADECGHWEEGENPQEVIEKHQVTTLNPARAHTKWGPEKYTDEGLSELVFRGLGQHRVTRVRDEDPHKEQAKYAVYLGVASGLEVRPGFANLGADAYFAADGKLLHIRRNGKTFYPTDEEGWESYTSKDLSEERCKALKGSLECTGNWLTNLIWEKECTCTVPSKVGWKHVKMAFLGTLNAVITAIDHLYGVHLTVANSIVTANVEQLPQEHPMRRFMQPFAFRTATINWAAAFSLTNEFGLVHRAMPMSKKGLRQLYKYAQTEAAGLTWRSIPERHAQQGLDMSIPLHEDGQDFYKVVKGLVHAYLSHHYNYEKNECGADKDLLNWHAAVNDIAPNHDLPNADDVTCEHVEELLTTFIYYVTAGHTHTGQIGAEIEDPCHMPWAWREGELCATPRTAFVTAVTMGLTSLEQPKLYDDYTHIFPHEAEKQIWRDFQKELGEFGEVVNQRNAKRDRPFLAFDLSKLEVSVGI